MKLNFILFSLGLALGLFLSYLYCSFSFANNRSVVSQKQTTNLERKVEVLEASYYSKVDSLTTHGRSLQLALNDTKSALRTAKQKAYSLQQKAYGLIREQYAPEVVQNTDRNCDPLALATEKYIESASVKDSIYKKTNSLLEEQLRNSDSIISLKEDQYQNLKLSYKESIECVDALLEANRKLSKKEKRQNAKSKVLSAALLIITGAAANYLIQQ